MSTLSELLDLGVMTPNGRDEFIRQSGSRIGHLISRELVGEALVGLKVLTAFQWSRVLAGQGTTLRVGNYLIRERLESGTAGTVFLGEHPVLRRRVAIKVVSIEEDTPEEAIDRFLSEARLLAAIDHPNVVSVYDAGRLDGVDGAPPVVYLVLEHLPDGDLERFVYARGPQPAALVCEWGRQIASALREVHASGVVHRDLKPSNLLLTDTQRLKLIDFGLAREYASVRTAPGVLLGSLEFLAPEQLADAPTAGPQADVYGLGAVLFWVLTGHLPIPPAGTRRETIYLLRMAAPRRAVELRPDIPQAVDDLLARMLARNPSDRPTPGEACAAFESLAAPSAMTTLHGVEFPSGADESKQLRAAVLQIEGIAHTRGKETAEARAAVLAALSSTAAARPTESNAHQQRVAAYTRFLADELATRDAWPMCADPVFVGDLTRAAAAHDLGLVGIPDDILTQDGKLLPSDRLVYETHPVVGDRILAELARELGPALPFLRILRAVVRHHHERWDGTGYPDKLADDHIPPVARIVAVADAYDTLRRGVFGEPSVPHAVAVKHIALEAGRAFDPAVVDALNRCEREFDKVYRMIPDGAGDGELMSDQQTTPA